MNKNPPPWAFPLAVLLYALVAAVGHADSYCPCACVPVTPAATVTPTRTATPVPTSTPTMAPTVTPNPVVTILFQEDTQAIFANPGIGFQTTRKTKSQVANPKNIPLTHATFRTCMHQINPSPGQYNWAEIDSFLTAANAQGQTTQLGMIAYDPYDCGGWLKNYVQGVDAFCSTENPNRTYWVPDWNNSTVQLRHRDFIAAFAARYDSDPRVDSIDLRSIGDYGEWHHSCLKVRSTGIALPMPSEAARNKIIKDYHDFFINKPLVHILDDAVARQEAVSREAGWRADCWGGHHEDTLYPGWLTSPVNMLSLWQTVPVALEPCGALTSTSYMSIVRRVDEAIEKHASLINTKNGISGTTFDAQWPEWQRLLRKLGYRFVLRKASVIDGGFILEIQNVGIAPNYKPLKVENATRGGFISLSRIMPNETRIMSLPGVMGDVVRFSIDGKPVRTANTTWQNGVTIQQ